MHRSLFSCSILLLCTTVVSCGQDAPSLSSKTDPCSLLTSADAARALGEPVRDAALSDPITCVYRAVRSASNAVTIRVDETPGKDRRNWFTKERLRRDSHLIPGLAGGAVRVYSPPSLARLTFIQGEALVTVMVASMKPINLEESVTVAGGIAAVRYGDRTMVASDDSGSATAADTSNQTTPSAPSSRTAPVTVTESRPVAPGSPAGPAKPGPVELATLVGTWHAQATQGTSKQDMLLVIQPNREWSLYSMMQFDGVVNAEGGSWDLERANTFRGLVWKGTYQEMTPKSFSSTGSIRATWVRLKTDQRPSSIPAELWQLRREATSVPVFQLKTVDPGLVGQWEGTGTYSGGSAAFVWSIKPSAASDLLIVDTISGTVVTKAGIPQLKPTDKGQRAVGIVAFNEGGFTTSDGKNNIRWTQLLPEPTKKHHL